MKASALPVRERTFRSGGRLNALRFPGVDRPSAYKDWDDERLRKACDAVKDEHLSVRRAAEQYRVPKSTLSDRVTGRVQFGSHSGPARYLSDAEEEELVSFLCGSARMGYARMKKDIMAIVEEVVVSKGKQQVHVSNGWWEAFRQRHPNLTLRTVEKLSYARSMASDVNVIDRYFDLLEQTILENGLADSPSQIFNCDETGLPLEHTPSSVIAEKGQRHPRALTSGNKKQISVLACSNAAGYVLPPLVIFGRKALNLDLTTGEVPGTMYGLSDNGWMDREIFDNWFTHHFLIHAPSARPLLLLLDGHSTHYNPGVVRTAAQERVIIFCLPPNTTHLTQPLDKGAFGPLKTYWNQECQKYMRRNPGKVVTQYDFMAVFSQAWYRAMTIPNMMSAFRTTGVYPLNRRAIEVNEYTPQSFDPTALSATTGLAFIPLYSPARTCTSRPKIPSRPAPEQRQFTQEKHAQFTQVEEAKFNRRFEEGYDVTTDERYNLWLEKYHSSAQLMSPVHLSVSPPASTLSDNSRDCSISPESPRPSNLLLGEATRPESVLRKFLQHPLPQVTKPRSYEKMSAKVLTSSECRKAVEEKERLKREKQDEKERRKQERERQRAEKAARLAAKSLGR